MLARPGILHEFAEDIAGRIYEHTQRDIDVAFDLVTGGLRNVRSDFVKHGRRSGLRRGRRLIRWRSDRVGECGCIGLRGLRNGHRSNRCGSCDGRRLRLSMLRIQEMQTGSRDERYQKRRSHDR